MENKEISLNTFSTLSNIGWALTLLKASNVINTDWHTILGYWLALFGIALTMSILAAIVKAVVKGGDNSAQ